MKQKFENRNLIEIFKNKKIKFPINKIQLKFDYQTIIIMNRYY